MSTEFDFRPDPCYVCGERKEENVFWMDTPWPYCPECLAESDALYSEWDGEGP